MIRNTSAYDGIEKHGPKEEDVRNRGLASVILAIGLVFLVSGSILLFWRGITPAAIIGAVLTLLGLWLRERSRREPPTAPPGSLPRRPM
jgi:hypothetical protein